MAANARKLVRAGAVSQLSRYFRSLGGKPHHWRLVREFAYREFRDIPAKELERLIDVTKSAVTAGRIFEAMPPCDILRTCDIPKLPK